MAHAPAKAMSVARRIWNYPVTRIVAFLLLFFLVTAVLMAPIGIFSIAFGLRLVRIPAVVFAVVEALGAFVAFFVMVHYVEGRSLKSAGFTVRGSATETIAGYLIGMAIFSLVIAIMAVIGVYHEVGRNAHFRPYLSLILFLFAGASEEIVFRGYIFQTLERRWGSGIAVICSSLIFGFAHAGNPGPHESVWHHLAGPAFICLEAGLPLSAAYLATRRLWLPIGIHWAWNFFEGPIYGADVSGISLPTLFRARFTGPFFLTGGSFGPEASVIALVVGTFAGLLLLRVAIRAGQWKKGEQEAAAAPVAAPLAVSDQQIDQVK